jgi:hypothetical protein
MRAPPPRSANAAAPRGKAQARKGEAQAKLSRQELERFLFVAAVRLQELARCERSR